MSDQIADKIAGHASRMYRVALRIVGCSDAAWEVAQDACVKSLRGAGDFDGRSSLATWLHRITVNCAHDHLRKSRRSDRDRTNWNGELLNGLAGLETTPDEHAVRKESYHIVLGYIAELPDDCRSAFVLTQMDGYTYDDAAAIEAISRGTVASRVHRARKILMERIGADPVGETS